MYQASMHHACLWALCASVGSLWPCQAPSRQMRQLIVLAANAAMLHWLKAPALPRPFVMDLLDFVLGNSAAVFRELPAFEHALLLRVCSLLTTQLQNLLDPLAEPALQASDLRVTLRAVRTVITQFHRQLRSKCSVFIETLLAGGAVFPAYYI